MSELTQSGIRESLQERVRRQMRTGKVTGPVECESCKWEENCIRQMKPNGECGIYEPRDELAVWEERAE